MSNDSAEAFVDHLRRLHERDRGAIATLRHSLSFGPGDYPKAYPHVERHIGADWHERDPRRLARYALAGLFASHPVSHPRSLPAALGQLMRDKERPSLELRFVALLGADAESVMDHLRQAIRLLASEGLGYDHAALLKDLAVALDPRGWPDARDRLKRRWAREFYRALQSESNTSASGEAAVATDSMQLTD